MPSLKAVASTGTAWRQLRPRIEDNMSTLKRVPMVVWLITAFAALIAIGVALS